MEGVALERTRFSVCLFPSSPEVLDAVYAAQELVGRVPQVEVETEHVFHAGMYARTVRLPAGVVAVGTLIKVATILILHGDVDLLAGDSSVEIRGYCVLPGDPGRKQAFVTRSAVEMTMLFPTQATSVDEVEREFTDEYAQLITRKG